MSPTASQSMRDDKPGYGIEAQAFLTIAEAADLLRIRRRTLDNMRWKGAGPPFRRHGGRIVYHRDELLAWSAQRRARQKRS